jgi:hypothetical protein
MEPQQKPEGEPTPAASTPQPSEPDFNVDELVTPAAANLPAPGPAPDQKPPRPVIMKLTLADRWRSFLWWCSRKKRQSILLTLLLIAGILLAVPYTRYLVLGSVLQRNYKVEVLDKTSSMPVSNAVVSVKGKSVKTDAKGLATLKVKVGKATLTAAKKYYNQASQQVLVPINQKDTKKIYVTATGRQVPVTVIDTITGKPVDGALLTAAGTEARTDKDGKAVIVLPADKKTADATIKTTGYNDLGGLIVVTEATVKANTFAVTPAGKVYFLSRLSGKIDVVKTNLDGTERKTVLAGTGKENNVDTILLASRDWKYLVLKSNRDGSQSPKLYLIDTATDKVATIDEGNADFTLVGWADHQFVYVVNRKGIEPWQPKSQALKTFDASTGKLTVIDETDGEGTGLFDYVHSLLGQVIILDGELVYNKNWEAGPSVGYRLNGKTIGLISVKPDGTNKHSLRDFPIQAGFNYYGLTLRLYEPHGIYIRVPAPDNKTRDTYYVYENGKVSIKNDLSDQNFNEAYPTYLLSPEGKQTLWADPRDGKYALFVGDADGQNAKQVVSLSEYYTYGWFTDDFLLVSKNASELYIMPRSGGAPLKISDYHKPNYNFSGYGGGYGGL